MVLTCLFWNFKFALPDQEAIVARAAVEHSVDLLVLAESSTDPDLLLAELRRSHAEFDYPAGQHERFQIFTRFSGHCFTSLNKYDRLSIHRLSLPSTREITLAVIHFYDRRNFNPDSQASLVRDVYLAVHSAEDEVRHTRTVVVGDFNMNPFEKGMIDVKSGFGAMMSRELAIRHSSKDMIGPRRFYNSSWSRLGRVSAPGTYYWKNVSDPLNIFWHSIDQVLVRPALFDYFKDEDFQILTSIPSPGGGTIDLIRSTGKHNAGKHWEVQVSDHLPVLFKLQLPKEESSA